MQRVVEAELDLALLQRHGIDPFAAAAEAQLANVAGHRAQQQEYQHRCAEQCRKQQQKALDDILVHE